MFSKLLTKLVWALLVCSAPWAVAQKIDNNKEGAMKREDLPKNKHLSRLTDHTFYTQVHESRWEPGDGDKPRILTAEAFRERVAAYERA
ncbi:MAG: hypothetical protein OXT67_11650 [Zetaproteobacteria bacterium]|nr:hypothetical protein [Zetaproteobacteria bacterium]